MKSMQEIILSMIQDDTRKNSAEHFMTQKDRADQEFKKQIEQLHEEFEKHKKTLLAAKNSELAQFIEHRSTLAQRELLRYRRELLDEIFDEAIDKLKNISNDTFLAFLKNAVNGITGTFSLTLGAHSKNKLSVQDVTQLNGGMKGLTLSLAAETIPHKSGFILSDDHVEYNCLFEDLMEEKKYRQLAEIQRIVFSSGE